MHIIVVVLLCRVYTSVLYSTEHKEGPPLVEVTHPTSLGGDTKEGTARQMAGQSLLFSCDVYLLKRNWSTVVEVENFCAENKVVLSLRLFGKALGILCFCFVEFEYGTFSGIVAL